jgi:hypothetical protein
MMAPNTREYLSPEARRFAQEHEGDKKARYEVRSTDDVYALAVSMYRLLTGVYPPPGRAPVAARMLNPRAVRELVELVERGLAKEPRERAYAGEWAQAADSAAERAGPEADEPLFEVQGGAQVLEATKAPRGVVILRGARAARAAVAAASTAVAVVVLCQGEREPWTQGFEVAQAEAQHGERALDGGTRGVGEEALSTQLDAQEVAVTSASAITVELPSQPLPGQRRPPCPRSVEVAINGGCWKLQSDIQPPCDDYFEWRGACFMAVMERPRQRVPTTQKQQ